MLKPSSGTEADIRTETADATLRRKRYGDRISSYRSRLENARFALYGFTGGERDPRDEANRDIFP